MSVHRRCLSIVADAVSRFETIPAGPVEALADLESAIALDKARLRSRFLSEEIAADRSSDPEDMLEPRIEHPVSLYWAMSCVVI